MHKNLVSGVDQTTGTKGYSHEKQKRRVFNQNTVLAQKGTQYRSETIYLCLYQFPYRYH